MAGFGGGGNGFTKDSQTGAGGTQPQATGNTGPDGQKAILSAGPVQGGSQQSSTAGVNWDAVRGAIGSGNASLYSGMGSASGLPGQGTTGKTPYYGGTPGQSAAANQRYQQLASSARDNPAPAADYRDANNTYLGAMGAEREAMGGDRNAENAALAMMQQAAAGKVPSAAQIQMQQGISDATRQQLAAAASARGGAGAIASARQAAVQQGAQMQAQGVGQTAALRANEMAAARSAVMQGAGQIQQGDLSAMQAMTGIGAQQQQEAQNQAVLQAQANALNAQTGLGYEGLAQNVQQDNLQAQLAALGYGTQMQMANNQQGANLFYGALEAGAGVVGAAFTGGATAPMAVDGARRMSSADADLVEPGGGAHWTLREEDDFILAKNQRTGEMRKLVTAPLSEGEQKQAHAKHGAGPLGADDPRRARTIAHDLDMDSSLSGPGAGVDPSSGLASVAGMSGPPPQPMPTSGPGEMPSQSDIAAATAGARSDLMPHGDGSMPPASVPPSSAAATGRPDLMPAQPPPMNMPGGTTVGGAVTSAAGGSDAGSGGITKQQALAFLRGTQNAFARNRSTPLPQIQIPTIGNQNPTGLQAGAIVSDKRAKEEAHDAGYWRGVSDATRPEAQAVTRGMPPVVGNEGHMQVLSPAGYIPANTGTVPAPGTYGRGVMDATSPAAIAATREMAPVIQNAGRTYVLGPQGYVEGEMKKPTAGLAGLADQRLAQSYPDMDLGAYRATTKKQYADMDLSSGGRPQAPMSPQQTAGANLGAQMGAAMMRQQQGAQGPNLGGRPPPPVNRPPAYHGNAADESTMGSSMAGPPTPAPMYGWPSGNAGAQTMGHGTAAPWQTAMGPEHGTQYRPGLQGTAMAPMGSEMYPQAQRAAYGMSAPGQQGYAGGMPGQGWGGPPPWMGGGGGGGGGNASNTAAAGLAQAAMLSDARAKVDPDMDLAAFGRAAMPGASGGHVAADEFLRSLKPREFGWRDPALAPNPKAAVVPNLGVYAQDVERSPWGAAIVQDDPRTGLKTLDPKAMVGGLAAGAGALKAQQDEHEARLSRMEGALGMAAPRADVREPIEFLRTREAPTVDPEADNASVVQYDERWRPPPPTLEERRVAGLWQLAAMRQAAVSGVEPGRNLALARAPEVVEVPVEVPVPTKRKGLAAVARR